MERFRYFEDFCLCFCVSPWQLHAFGQPPQVPPQECFPFLRSLRMDRTIAAMIATTMIPTMTLPIEMPPFETSGQFCLGLYRTKIVRQMRRQIFRQMKQKAEWILDIFTSIFVKYESLFRIWRMQIASSDFLRDEGKNGENPLWIFEYFPEISRKICTQDACEKIRNRLWRKICKQMAGKVARRSLCGIAQDVFCRCKKTHPFNYNRVVGFCQPIFLGFGRFAVWIWNITGMLHNVHLDSGRKIGKGLDKPVNVWYSIVSQC